MSKLLVKPQGESGRVSHVTPAERRLDLCRLRPPPAEARRDRLGRDRRARGLPGLRHRQGQGGGRRQGAWLARRAHVAVRRQAVVGLRAARLGLVGDRRNRSRARGLLGAGPRRRPAGARHRARQLGQEVRGKGTNTRYVTNILPEGEPADSLLVVEVITPGGHTSSYPPHKHDQDNLPAESYLEETYYHRLNPPQGFAFQRVYTDATERARWTRRWRSRTATWCWCRRATIPAPPATATTSTISTSWPGRSAPGNSTTRRSTNG